MFNDAKDKHLRETVTSGITGIYDCNWSVMIQNKSTTHVLLDKITIYIHTEYIGILKVAHVSVCVCVCEKCNIWCIRYKTLSLSGL